MRPAKLASLLSVTIAAHLPVMIKGAPGVGKTDVVKQATALAKADLILMHPVVSDPTDPKGLPAIVKDENGKDCAVFLPYGDLKKMMEATKLTVVFMDDLGQAPAVVQAAYMQLILAREINGHKISDEVVFIAATNRREDRAGVTGILEPVKSRFATIVELEPTTDDWCDWALQNDVPAEVVAFIRFRPELLMDTKGATADIVNRPSPRTVTNAGRLFEAGLDDPEVLAGAAGEGFATEFVGFLQVFKELPSIDAILASPKTEKVPTKAAALYAVAVALASRCTAKNAPAVVAYLNRLPEEFSVLGMRDARRVCPKVTECREFVTWAEKHSEVLG